MAWLGQAGFALRYENLHILLDPYLQTTSRRNIAAPANHHERLMAAPIQVQEVELLDFVICTHQHSDHMDPEALPILASKCPAISVYCSNGKPGASVKPGSPDKQILGINAAEKMLLSSSVLGGSDSFEPHEALEKNERGEYRYLGYIIRLGSMGFTIREIRSLIWGLPSG